MVHVHVPDVSSNVLIYLQLYVPKIEVGFNYMLKTGENWHIYREKNENTVWNIHESKILHIPVTESLL